MANGGYEQVGTCNGNPLARAAARAMLCELATDQAYERIERLRTRAVTGLVHHIARCGLAAHVVSAGAKGCVVFSPEPVRDYRGFLDLDDRYSQAHWLFQHNGGVFLPPWGKTEQWLISVQHEESDIDLLVANFAGLAKAISIGAPGLVWGSGRRRHADLARTISVQAKVLPGESCVPAAQDYGHVLADRLVRL